jgi:phosphopantothenoylcysteine synthetase/decarboxylase
MAAVAVPPAAITVKDTGYQGGLVAAAVRDTGTQVQVMQTVLRLTVLMGVEMVKAMEAEAEAAQMLVLLLGSLTVVLEVMA